jgi:pentatricopeptide repeat protein
MLLVQVTAIMDTMREAGIQPSAVSYGCALAACELSQDAHQAFKLYHEACEAGVMPTDNLHNALIKVCVSAGMLDDALEQIKSLIRGHGHMQQHTINSLTRALSEQYIGMLPFHCDQLEPFRYLPVHLYVFFRNRCMEQ